MVSFQEVCYISISQKYDFTGLSSNDQELEALIDDVSSSFRIAAEPAKDAETIYAPIISRYRLLEQQIQHSK